jgi:hypothetical protein
LIGQRHLDPRRSRGLAATRTKNHGEDTEEEDYIEERIVFKFGETNKSVEEKLYTIDLILNYDETKVKK